MVDLEKLAQTCREKNRWTFFVTSAPANVPGKLSCAVPGFDHANAEYSLRRCCFSCKWYCYLLKIYTSVWSRNHDWKRSIYIYTNLRINVMVQPVHSQACVRHIVSLDLFDRKDPKTAGPYRQRMLLRLARWCPLFTSRMCKAGRGSTHWIFSPERHRIGGLCQ